MSTKPVMIVAAVALTATMFAGCVAPEGSAEIFGTSTGGTMTPGTVVQAGSSTVYPLAEVWAEEFGTTRGITFELGIGGSGAGASGICNKKLDLGDMSRPMKQSEKDGDCAKNGVDPVEWIVAFDGLSVVVSKENTFVQDLTVEQLAHIFRAEDHATTWNEVDPDYPEDAIRLCYPDNDSGTYEYFGEAIIDGEPRTGAGVEQSPDDNVLVRCLQNDVNAIGYFGFAYLQENSDTLRAVKVEGVEPTFVSIADGSYTPLSRPIFIYSNGIPTGVLADYFHYVMHPEGGQRLIESVGYVALDETTRLSMLDQLGM